MAKGIIVVEIITNVIISAMVASRMLEYMQ